MVKNKDKFSKSINIDYRDVFTHALSCVAKQFLLVIIISYIFHILRNHLLDGAYKPFNMNNYMEYSMPAVALLSYYYGYRRCYDDKIGNVGTD